MSLLIVAKDTAGSVAPSRPLEQARAAAVRQGFGAPEAMAWQGGVAWWHATPGMVRGSGGFAREGARFAAYVGALSWRSLTGVALLGHLLAHWSEPAQMPLDEFSGSFAMLYAGGDGVWLFGDALGLQKIYVTDDEGLMSTSFMVCRAAVDNPGVNRLRAQEYVLLGANHGLETPLREVSILEPTTALDLSGARSAVLSPPARWRAAAPMRNFDDAVEAVSSAIKAEFQNLAGAYGTNIGMALSGGFDSRLILAALDSVGVAPALYVYGANNDSDVRVASAIAKRLDLPIETIDKNLVDAEQPPLTSQQLSANLAFFDGLPVDGALDRGADRLTRLKQVSGGRLNLNGGGGEILRNFFLLPGRRFRAADLVAAFYSNWLPGAIGAPREREAFFAQLANEILKCLGYDATRDADRLLDRDEVELVYSLFRLRYWMGRNNSVAAGYGLFMTPLVCPGLVPMAASIPLAWKTHGRLEAAVITRLSPRVAAGPSNYGFDFSQGPSSAHRARVTSTLVRPPALRRRSARIRRLLGLSKFVRPAAEWQAATAGLRGQDWINEAELTSSGQLNRLRTLQAVLDEQS